MSEDKKQDTNDPNYVHFFPPAIKKSDFNLDYFKSAFNEMNKKHKEETGVYKKIFGKTNPPVDMDTSQSSIRKSKVDWDLYTYYGEPIESPFGQLSAATHYVKTENSIDSEEIFNQAINQKERVAKHSKIVNDFLGRKMKQVLYSDGTTTQIALTDEELKIYEGAALSRKSENTDNMKRSEGTTMGPPRNLGRNSLSDNEQVVYKGSRKGGNVLSKLEDEKDEFMSGIDEMKRQDKFSKKKIEPMLVSYNVDDDLESYDDDDDV